MVNSKLPKKNQKEINEDNVLDVAKRSYIRIPFDTVDKKSKLIFDKKEDEAAEEINFLKNTKLSDMKFENTEDANEFTIKNIKDDKEISLSNRASTNGEFRGAFLRTCIEEEKKRNPDQTLYEALNKSLRDPQKSGDVRIGWNAWKASHGASPNSKLHYNCFLANFFDYVQKKTNGVDIPKDLDEAYVRRLYQVTLRFKEELDTIEKRADELIASNSIKMGHDLKNICENIRKKTEDFLYKKITKHEYTTHINQFVEDTKGKVPPNILNSRLMEIEMKVYIQPLSEPRFEVECMSGDTILRLKQKIFEQKKLDVDKQRLLYAGKEFVNGSMLDATKDGVTILLVQRIHPMKPSELLCHLSFEELKQNKTEIDDKMDKEDREKWDSATISFVDRMTLLKKTVGDTEFAELDKKQQAPSQQTLTNPAPNRENRISFNEFHTTFLALFDDTNSTGIKQVLKKMREVSTRQDDLSKFQSVAKLMKEVAEKRVNKAWSKSQFFGPGRSQLATEFYDYVGTKKTLQVSNSLDAIALSFQQLANNINRNGFTPGDMRVMPQITFDEFQKKFRENYGKTTSTGIRKVLKQLEALSKQQNDPLKNSDPYKFTKICKIMRDVTNERAEKIKSGRSEQTKAFYKLVKDDYANRQTLVTNILNVPADVKLAVAPTKAK